MVTLLGAAGSVTLQRVQYERSNKINTRDARECIDEVSVLLPAYIVQRKVRRVPASIVGRRNHVNGSICDVGRVCRRNGDIGRKRCIQRCGVLPGETVVAEVPVVEMACAKCCRGKEWKGKEGKHPAT